MPLKCSRTSYLALCQSSEAELGLPSPSTYGRTLEAFLWPFSPYSVRRFYLGPNQSYICTEPEKLWLNSPMIERSLDSTDCTTWSQTLLSYPGSNESIAYHCWCDRSSFGNTCTNVLMGILFHRICRK